MVSSFRNTVEGILKETETNGRKAGLSGKRGHLVKNSN